MTAQISNTDRHGSAGATPSDHGTAITAQLEKLSASIDQQRESLSRLQAAIADGDTEQQLRAVQYCMTCFMMFQAMHEQINESTAALLDSVETAPTPTQTASTAPESDGKNADRARFDALAYTADALSSSLDPTEVLYQALEMLMQITGAERAFLLTADPNCGEMKFTLSRNFEEQTMHGTSFAVSRTVVDQVVRDGVPIVTNNAAADPRFSAQKSIAIHSLRSIVCVPLKDKEKVFAVIYADHRIKMGQFSSTDVDFVAAFASQASTALQNAQLFGTVSAARNLMRNVFESMESGVIAVDPDGVITLFNQASESILNMQSDECLGLPAQLVLPILDGAILDLIDEVTERGHPASDNHAIGTIEGRGAITVTISAVPLTNATGEFQGVTLLLEDRTEQVRVERERNLVKRYLPSQLVDSISDVNALGLGGARRNVSVFFADIRGFTSFSEHHDPGEVMDLINAYFGIASSIIQDNNGIIDKYMGDAVMAHYNSPLLPDEAHAWSAVKTAWETRQKMAEFIGQQSWEHPLAFGIGVHTGDALAGNVGASTRMEYTLIGDAVNVAKRLQEAAGPGQVLISQATFAAVRDRVIVSTPNSIRLKGRSMSETTYELVGLANPA